MPDVRDAHPSLEELTAFDRGQLQAAERAAVEEHVAVCAACCQRLDSIGDDELVALLRSSAGPMPHTASMDTCALPADTPRSADEPARIEPPAELLEHPRYRVLGPLGAGGMGVVFKAEHRLMERTVALKVIHKSLTDRPDAVERFRQEVKAAARLSHPNIVAAYDAEQAGELHFLIMEFVEGTSLDRLIRARGPLPVTSACHIIRQAALGLQHAFERGMVHRDVKPANVLLTPGGQVKVLDFGLARLVSAGSGGSLTVPGAVVGTPDYLAPEQARDSRHADVRADIYSLGCTLYFLLAGRPPFPEGSALQKLMGHQERTPRPLGEVRPDVPAELVRILDRMMAKDPAQRCQTPAEVADELAPFVEGDTTPPAPRPPGAAENDETILNLADVPGAEVSPGLGPPPPPPTCAGGRGGRRRRWWLLLVAAVLLVVAGGVLGVAGWRLARDWRQNHSSADTRPGSEQPAPAELLGEGELRRIGKTPATFTRSVFSADCRQALVAGLDFNVHLWDLDRGEEVGILEGHTGRPMGLAFSRDGRYALSGGMDATVRLWDLPQRRLLQTLRGHRSWARGVAFTADARQAVSGANDGRVLFWDVRGGQLLHDFGATALVFSVAASPRGRLAVSAGEDGIVRTWDLVGLHPAHSYAGHEGAVHCAILSEDGRFVVAGGVDGTVRIWEAATEKQVHVLRGHTAGVTTVAFSADNRRALSGSSDGTVRYWDVENEEQRACFKGHGDVINSVAFCPDGRRALSAGRDGTFRFWRLPPVDARRASE